MCFESNLEELKYVPKRDLHMIVPTNLLVIVTSNYPHHANLQASHNRTPSESFLIYSIPLIADISWMGSYSWMFNADTSSARVEFFRPVTGFLLSHAEDTFLGIAVITSMKTVMKTVIRSCRP